MPVRSAINRSVRMISLLAGLLLCSAAWTQQNESAPDPLKPQYTEKGAEKCLLCHSELRIELMTETPHGDRNNPDAPFAKHDCESCHGPGSFHVSRSRRGKGRPPMTTFGKDAKTPVKEQVQVCLGCHAKNRDELLKIKGHENAKEVEGITCSACHTVHQLPPGHEHKAAELSAALTARRQASAEYTERGSQKCLLCHAETRMSLIAKTPHGNRSNPGTPFAQHGCESCHGKGSLHVSRSLRGKGRPAMITFGRRAKTPVDEQIATCLACHGKDREALLEIDGHKNAKNARDTKTLEGLTCSTCHTMHPYPEGGGPSPSASYTKLGPQKCRLCHSSKRVQQVVNGPHGNSSNPHTPFAKQGCETCHGKGSLHVSQSRRGQGRPPMIAFGEDKHTPPNRQTTVCLSCHGQEMGALPAMGWQGSVHDQQELTCSGCHGIHTEGNPLKDRQVQADTCFSCHEDRKTEHPRFEDKFIDFDSLSCWTCHDVHQLIPQHEAGAE